MMMCGSRKWCGFYIKLQHYDGVRSIKSVAMISLPQSTVVLFQAQRVAGSLRRPTLQREVRASIAIFISGARLGLPPHLMDMLADNGEGEFWRFNDLCHREPETIYHAQSFRIPRRLERI
jgi:hypothetical protein